MRLLIIDHISSSIHSLRRTRMRTLLTTLGVAIGVASMTTILALSGGITGVISHQIDALGGNIAVVQPQSAAKSSAPLSNPLNQQFFNTSTLSEADLKSISSLPDVKAAAPLMVIEGSLQAGSTILPGSTVLATTPAFTSITNLTMRDGQFIDSVTNKDTAVLGPQLAINLFGTDQPIGQNFTMRGHTFTVIGVLKRQNNPVNFNNVDLDTAAIISLESGKRFHEGTAQLQQIDVQAVSVDRLPSVVASVNQKLRANHGNEQDFTVISGKEIAQPTNDLFKAVTGVLTAVAAISLVVGGIGIMNIMLVNVAERTREIGIRKAVGASNRNIVSQFMTEALIISLLGGILGYAAGYLCAFGISTFLTFDPAFTWEIAVAALGTSVGVGLLFGLYPALRAARKDPIESLRQYH